MNWFAQQRQEWIAETLYVFGFINREHLMRKFDISQPQASSDMQTYLRTHSNVVYNLTTKRYEQKEK